jgi:hypothetical protein
MTIFPPSATDVRFDDAVMWVDLEDGRTLGIPIIWFPRLLHATPEQRMDFFLSPSGIHWDEIDEDISIGGLLAGYGDITHPVQSAA